MAALVDDDDVKAIITTTIPDLSAFIEAADLIIVEDLSNKGMSAARLKEIERWLAAHFVAINEDAARISSETVGRSNISYGGQFGLGLQHTRYGQQAIILDITGTLASKSQGRKSSIIALPNISKVS